jgi:hypothetical protein
MESEADSRSETPTLEAYASGLNFTAEPRERGSVTERVVFYPVVSRGFLHKTRKVLAPVAQNAVNKFLILA